METRNDNRTSEHAGQLPIAELSSPRARRVTIEEFPAPKITDNQLVCVQSEAVISVNQSWCFWCCLNADLSISGIETKPLCMLGKCSTSKLRPSLIIKKLYRSSVFSSPSPKSSFFKFPHEIGLTELSKLASNLHSPHFDFQRHEGYRCGYHDLCCSWHIFNPLVFNHSGEIGGWVFVVVVVVLCLIGSSRDQIQALMHAKIFSPLSSIPCPWFWRQSLHVPTVYVAQAGHKLWLLMSTETAGVLHCAWGWVSLFPFPSRLRYSLAVYVIEYIQSPWPVFE